MVISKNMLTMSVLVQSVIGKSADRKPVYSDLIELNNVWFDVNNGIINSSNGIEPSDNGTLYFDAVHSTPSDFAFTDDMRVIYDGRTYTVRTIKKCHSVKGFSHWEIGVV